MVTRLFIVGSLLLGDVREAGKAVVHVERGDHRLMGSGTVISPELVLTIKHVVNEGPNYNYIITFQDNKSVFGKVLAISNSYDGPALIKIPRGNYPIAEIAPRTVRAGKDKIWALGYPSGVKKLNYMTATVQRGGHIGGTDVITFQDGQIPGYSGGPLFNRNGQIIGVASHVNFQDDVTLHITLPTIAKFCYQYGVRPGVLYSDDGRALLPPPSIEAPK